HDRSNHSSGGSHESFYRLRARVWHENLPPPGDHALVVDASRKGTARLSMTMIQAGQTANFVVSYDDSITIQNGYQATGLSLAQAVLASCENDLAALSNLFGGIMPAAASLPFQINLVPGGGGGSHSGCLSTAISCYISPNSDAIGVPLTTDAEVAEVFMATQGQGVNCAYSNGEALSRVLPGV